MERVKVFVSSTSEYLDARKVLKDELAAPFDMFFYEDVVARGVSPQRFCEEKLGAADLFIGIFGRRHGSPMPGDESGRSIVEWEFDTAQTRKELETAVFLGASADDPDVDEAQRVFLQRVTGFKTGVWCRSFKDTTDLVRLVNRSLLDWFARRLAAMRQHQQSLRDWLSRRVLIVVAIAAVAGGACLIPEVQGRLSTNAIVAILLGVFFSAVAVVVLWKRESDDG